MKKHILLSVAGISPAIITETLCGLYKKQIFQGEIHLVTTDKGKKSMQKLLGTTGLVADFNQEYQTHWEIQPDWIEAIVDKHRHPLEDLRTSDDNQLAANFIMHKVQKFTEESNTILHASLAGGRRTMGFFLYQSMSWYAREEDDLSHVLVPYELEQDKDFFFPRKNNPEHYNVVDFADLPFVRLRGLR